MTPFSETTLDPALSRHGLRILAGKIWKNLGLPKVVSEITRRNQQRKKLQWKLQHAERYRERYAEYNRRPEVRERANKRNSEKYQEKRAWLDSRKTRTPCKDCGGVFPACCMDYDHLPGVLKTENLSKMVGNTSCKISDMEIEIAKCELVCANCHRIRSYITRNPK